MYIILDTETTGLSHTNNYKDLEKYDNSRMVQLSYMICDNDFNQIIMKDFIIKRNNFEINNTEFHNITNEISDTDGINLNEVSNEFYKDILNAKYIIAHNAIFDINILKSEFYRNELNHIIDELDNKIIICSMEKTKYIVNAKNKKTNKIKYPSLNELYYYTCGENMTNHHNSKYDVLNLYKSLQMITIQQLI